MKIYAFVEISARETSTGHVPHAFHCPGFSIWSAASWAVYVCSMSAPAICCGAAYPRARLKRASSCEPSGTSYGVVMENGDGVSTDRHGGPNGGSLHSCSCLANAGENLLWTLEAEACRPFF